MSATESKPALVASASYAVYDKRGIPILPGDTIKVFHYVAAMRREKRYMYKFATQVVWRASDRAPLLQLSHLNLRNEWYWEIMDGRTLNQCEIVQGYEGVGAGQDFRDRPRHNSASPSEMKPSLVNDAAEKGEKE